MTLRSFVTCAFVAALPAVAAAQQASTLNAVAMRAGPDSGYPLVASYGPGTPITVQGCVEGYAWCDVIGPNGYRGWVHAGAIGYPYQRRQVPVLGYGAAIGIPVVSFAVGPYWAAHYPHRAWYRERARWEVYRPVVRPGAGGRGGRRSSGAAHPSPRCRGGGPAARRRPDCAGAGAWSVVARKCSSAAACSNSFRSSRGGIYLNHGTVGVTPLAVMRARAAILEEIERHPARYMIRELMQLGMSAPPELPRLRAAAGRVAEFVGVRPEDLVFVDNASSGVNAVLRAIELEPGDEILLTDHAYGGVARAAAFIARQRGATVATVALPFPPRDPDRLRLRAVAAAITPRTRLAVLDHVSSETALVMPLAAMAAACRARGVPVLVDGAHAPGPVALDIAGLDVDWYAANLHKWCFAPRSCGILWAAPERQAALHPGGHLLGHHQRRLAAGVRVDRHPRSLALAGGAGRPRLHARRARRGGDARLQPRPRLARARCAWASAGARPGPRRRRWSAAWSPCRLPARLGPASVDNAQRLRDALFFGHRIEAPVIARGGALWARLSMQVYNEDEDVERFAAAVESLTA